MIFLTEYIKNDKKFCGRVEADTWHEADLIVKQTGYKGERVIGSLEEEIEISMN